MAGAHIGRPIPLPPPSPSGRYTVPDVVFLSFSSRFDGRTIRVDKASDTGPRGGGYGGRGGGGGFGQRGGYGGSPQLHQVPFGGHQQQQYPMGAPPVYGQPYGGRGGYGQQVPQYSAPPAQGKDNTNDSVAGTAPRHPPYRKRGEEKLTVLR